VHSRANIHGDLSLERILLDLDWTVNIADFGHSASFDAPRDWLAIGSAYLAPEYYDGTIRHPCDVFPFGVILFEILAGRPACPKSLNWQIDFTVTIKGAQPEIPASVLAPTRALITDCGAAEPDARRNPGLAAGNAIQSDSSHRLGKKGE
jgi:serine/threonine protein kinase